MSAIALRDPVYPLLTAAEWEPELRKGQFPGDPIVRLERIHNTGYTVLSSELLDELLKFIGTSSVFEVGAGSGYLSRVLADHGVDVVGAIDSQDGNNTRDEWWDRPRYFDVQKVKVEDLDGLPGEIILMTWPCMSDFAFNVIQKMRPGQFLLYHGESKGGCTANARFFDRLEKGPFVRVNTDAIEDQEISEIGQLDRWSAYYRQSISDI